MMQTRLYVRGNESILIVRFPASLSLNTFGPGREQKRYDFEDNIAFEGFWRSVGESLSADGWVLSPLADRRHAIAVERRAAA